MKYYQMTMQEMLADQFEPICMYDPRKGLNEWFCPLCGTCVGIWSSGAVHETGWLAKRNVCPNGHKIKWEE